MKELSIGQYPAGELEREKSELRWGLAERLVIIGCFTGLAATLEKSRRWKLIDCKVAWSGCGLLGAAGLGKGVGSIVTVKQLQRGRVGQEDAPQLGKYMSAQCELIEGGVASLAKKRELINSAQYELKISGNFCGGKVFDELLENEIQQALDRDVRVELITSADLLTSKNYKTLKELKNPLFHVVICAQRAAIYPRTATYENHMKMVIVDGHKVQTGGIGIEDYLCTNGDGKDDNAEHELPLGPRLFVGAKGMRDSDILITSDDFAALSADQFDRLWVKWGGEPSEKIEYDRPAADAVDVQVAMHVGSPEHGEQNSWKRAILDEIGNTARGDTIKIAGMAFHEEELIGALVEAKNRGVKIEVITNGYGEKSPRGNFFQGPVHALHYHKLEDIWEFDADKTIYHKKVWLFERPNGESVAVHGTANINYKSTYCDDELIVKVKGDAMFQAAKAAFEADKALSTKVTDRSGSRIGRVLDALLRYHIF